MDARKVFACHAGGTPDPGSRVLQPQKKATMRWLKGVRENLFPCVQKTGFFTFHP